MNELQIFNSEEFGEIRTVTIDNEPWFVGIDVAKSLGYANPKNIKTILDFSGRYYTTKGDCPVCNREGLYKSDFYCNKCGQKLDWDENHDR